MILAIYNGLHLYKYALMFPLLLSKYNISEIKLSFQMSFVTAIPYQLNIITNAKIEKVPEYKGQRSSAPKPD